MIKLHITLDIDSFKENLNEFNEQIKIEKKEQTKIETKEQTETKQTETKASYTESLAFGTQELIPFLAALKKSIKQNLTKTVRKSKDPIETQANKIMEKILCSPAGYSLSHFGLAELLKNAAEPGLTATKLNFIIALDDEKEFLNPRGVTILVIDNGSGFSEKDYLDKDKEKKQEGFSNVHIIKDPGYVEGKLENKLVAKERKKTTSNKEGKLDSFGGRGLGLIELAKAATVYEEKNPTNILGRMLVGNIKELNKSTFKSLTSDIPDFTLPTQGAVTILYSPYYSDQLKESCGNSFSSFYNTHIVGKILGKQSEEKAEEEEEEEEEEDAEIDVEQNLSASANIFQLLKNSTDNVSQLSQHNDEDLESNILSKFSSKKLGSFSNDNEDKDEDEYEYEDDYENSTSFIPTTPFSIPNDDEMTIQTTPIPNLFGHDSMEMDTSGLDNNSPPTSPKSPTPSALQTNTLFAQEKEDKSPMTITPNNPTKQELIEKENKGSSFTKK